MIDRDFNEILAKSESFIVLTLDGGRIQSYLKGNYRQLVCEIFDRSSKKDFSNKENIFPSNNN